MHDCIHIYWFLVVLRDHFGSILGSWETTLASLWRSFGARVHSGRPLGVPKWFFLIFDRFWVPHWGHFCVTFSYFLWFEVSKSGFGLQERFLMIFDWKTCWILMSRSFKNIANTVVFIRLRFFGFYAILIVSGTSWNLIFEVSGGLQAQFWWYLRVFGTHRNFIEKKIKNMNFIEFYHLAGWTQNPEDLVRCW